jgi:hypothetical protein
MKKAQNLVEYALIVALVAVVGGFAISKFDFGKIRDVVFSRPTGTGTSINIEAMTK